MSIKIVQVVDNEGPNPGNTQEPGGITTTVGKPLTKGNAFVGIITCATFGGQHSAETITDTEKNVFVVDKILQGTSAPASIDTAQQTILYHVNSLVGDGATADQIHQQFVGGDNDYQALLGVELAAPAYYVGCAGYEQIGMPPGKSNINSGAMVTVSREQMPAEGIGFSFNISALGEMGTITPVPTAPSSLVTDALSFFQNNGPGVAISVVPLGTNGIRAYFDNNSSAPKEVFQTFVSVWSETAPTGVSTNVSLVLTAAQTAALADGGTLTIQGTKA